MEECEVCGENKLRKLKVVQLRDGLCWLCHNARPIDDLPLVYLVHAARHRNKALYVEFNVMCEIMNILYRVVKYPAYLVLHNLIYKPFDAAVHEVLVDDLIAQLLVNVAESSLHHRLGELFFKI